MNAQSDFVPSLTVATSIVVQAFILKADILSKSIRLSVHFLFYPLDNFIFEIVISYYLSQVRTARNTQIISFWNGSNLPQFESCKNTTKRILFENFVPFCHDRYFVCILHFHVQLINNIQRGWGGRHDTQQSDIQHNNIQHTNTQHNGLICDKRHS